MDDTDILKMSGLSASSLAIVLIIYKLLKSAVGKKLVSNCCGRKLEVGMTVTDMPTTPREVRIEVQNPMTDKKNSPIEENGAPKSNSSDNRDSES